MQKKIKTNHSPQRELTKGKQTIVKESGRSRKQKQTNDQNATWSPDKKHIKIFPFPKLISSLFSLSENNFLPPDSSTDFFRYLHDVKFEALL